MLKMVIKTLSELILRSETNENQNERPHKNND